MIDLRSSYLYMKVQILKDDGAKIGVAPTAAAPDPDQPLIGPIQAIAKTFIRNLRLYVGGKLIYDANNHYAWRAYLETKFNFGPDAKSTHMAIHGYGEEDGPPGKHDANNDNEGLESRAKPYYRSRVVEWMAPLHADLAIQGKYLPSHCEIKIEIFRNSDKFILKSGAAAPNPLCKLHIVSMEFLVRRVILSPSAALGMESAILHRKFMKFPIRRVVVQVSSLLLLLL